MEGYILALAVVRWCQPSDASNETVPVLIPTLLVAYCLTNQCLVSVRGRKAIRCVMHDYDLASKPSQFTVVVNDGNQRKDFESLAKSRDLSYR